METMNGSGWYVFHWTDEPGDDALLASKSTDMAVTAYARLVKVTHSHRGPLEKPLLNLANGKSSVPHRGYVPDATHGFYTDTADIMEGRRA